MKNPNFPPKLNNNYNGIDPTGGFDFEVLYKDRRFAKFENMTMSFNNQSHLLPIIDWSLEKGIVNLKFLKDEFDIKAITGEQPILTNKKVVIRFEGTEENNIKGVYELETSLSNIKLGLMPGKRIVIVKLEGCTPALNFVPAL